jgi:hypothetical protein
MSDYNWKANIYSMIGVTINKSEFDLYSLEDDSGLSIIEDNNKYIIGEILALNEYKNFYGGSYHIETPFDVLSIIKDSVREKLQQKYPDIYENFSDINHYHVTQTIRSKAIGSYEDYKDFRLITGNGDTSFWRTTEEAAIKFSYEELRHLTVKISELGESNFRLLDGPSLLLNDHFYYTSEYEFEKLDNLINFFKGVVHNGNMVYIYKIRKGDNFSYKLEAIVV